MRNIKTSVQVEIHPSAYELAECFWAMDAEEQAGFFERLNQIADRLPMQLQAVIDNKHFTNGARAAMQMIGDYGNAAPYKLDKEQP